MVIGDEAQPKDTCEDCGADLKLQVLRSNAGYYLGRFCPNDGPYSRESDYFRTHKEAEAEMKVWQEDGVKPHARTPGYWGGE